MSFVKPTTTQAVLGYLKTQGFKPAVVDYQRRDYRSGVQVTACKFNLRGQISVDYYAVEDADYEPAMAKIRAALDSGKFATVREGAGYAIRVTGRD